MRTNEVHKSWPSVVALIGLVLIYFGERVIGGSDATRYVVSGLGGLAVLASVVSRVLELNRAGDDRRPTISLFVLSTFGLLVALVIYAATTFSEPGDGPDRLRAMIHVAWVLDLVVSLGGLVALELAVAPVAGIDRYEVRKVNLYFQRGLGAGLLVGLLFALNFVATREEAKVDLSFGQKALASDATKQLIRELTKPVRIVLYFPATNEVGEEVETFFDSLKGLSPNLTVERIDQALAGKVASETGVSENGFVAVSQDKSHEKWKVGLDWKGSRSRLKKLDSELAKALIKVTRQSKTAYFTVGHKERNTDPASDDARPGLRRLKKILEANQYKIKPLGLGEGLGSELPEDHSIIFIMGPEQPFLPEEVETIRAGLDKGARLFIALEAEREGDAMPEILADLGLKFDKTILANERAYIKVTRTPADVHYVVSNRYSSHKSVTTLTRNANKLFTAFAMTGALDKTEPTPPSVRVDLVLNAMAGTFGDVDGDNVFDRATEKKSTYGLAAAVTRTATTGSDRETRAFVLSDVDAVADDFLRNEGNALLLADIAYWLADVKEPVIPKVTEEDVQIQHRRDEDSLWFYSTTLGVPFLVLLLGFFVSSRRRKR